MTPSLLIRPVVVLVSAIGLNACGMINSDPHRFENLANSVAAIDLDGKRTDAAPSHTAAELGLRPPLRVEVMDPHTLWDVRDGLDSAIERAAPQLIAAAAPAVAEAVVQRASARVESASSRADLRPVLAPRPVAAPRTNRGLVQLGAYSSEASARSAWSRLKSGEAAWALNGLSPVYEGVEVGGRRLTRLKVATPAAGAAAVCAAAGIVDPWCNRAA